MIFNSTGMRWGTEQRLPSVSAATASVTTLYNLSGSQSVNLSFTVTEQGEPAIYTYQWYCNNAAVSGGTNRNLTVSKAWAKGTYVYYCDVTNAAGTVSTASVTITVKEAMPTFTFSGGSEGEAEDGAGWKWQQKNYSTGQWGIYLWKSGNIRFTDFGMMGNKVDAFLVGGGGGGMGWNNTYGAAGGGGGYTKTQKNKALALNTNQAVTIGAGGNADGDGGATSVVIGSTTYTANGGKKGALSGSTAKGGNGGSGGGTYSQTEGTGAGGSDGANGGNGGGTGQGTTTRFWGATDGTLCAGGGGAARAKGGSGGGGAGAWYVDSHSSYSKNGTNWRGGGGGGGWYSGGTVAAGKGGCGLVIIRSTR